MKFDNTFLEDEIRLGFYIPSTIKQAWSAELEVLNEIDKICVANSISYFADWGTFLGAVRHGGFIPWDDDIDLVMLREDYDKFLQIAPSLLPEGYSIHTFRNENNFVEFHAVVTNTESARFDKDYFNKFHGFPYMCCIDIFVLDYIYKDQQAEDKRIKDTTYIIAFADAMLAEEYNQESIEFNLKIIEKITNVKINREQNAKSLWINLYELAEAKCAEVTCKESDTLTQMVPWGLKNLLSARYPDINYKNIIRIPFENTTIPVPLCYDAMLTGRYGNYLKINKNGGAHEYPYFERDKSALEALLGHKILSYACPDTLPSKISGESWKTTISECLSNLAILHNNFVLLDSSLIGTICDLQELSIEIGNYIEIIKGSDCLCIKLIETYCENLYSLYNFVCQENITHNKSVLKASITQSTINSYNSVVSSIKQLLSKKEIVFLPIKSSYWNSMNSLYEQYKNTTDYDVYVVPIPYYYKEYDGTLSNEQYSTSGYPSSLNLYDYNSFSLELHHPDIIVFQSPYDEYNATTSVHPSYYSNKLINYTDKLVYIPWTNSYQLDVSDSRSKKNMAHYVCMPGIVYSDEIILPNKEIKQAYIEKLLEWSNLSQTTWENKIKVSELRNASIQNKNSKTILYYIGVGQVYQNVDLYKSKINSVINTFRNSADDIELIIGTNINSIDLTNNIDLSFVDDIYSIVRDFTLVEEPIPTSIIDKCDAYYGDSSHWCLEFTHRNKPVMIQDYNL